MDYENWASDDTKCAYIDLEMSSLWGSEHCSREYRPLCGFNTDIGNVLLNWNINALRFILKEKCIHK